MVTILAQDTWTLCFHSYPFLQPEDSGLPLVPNPRTPLLKGDSPTWPLGSSLWSPHITLPSWIRLIWALNSVSGFTWATKFWPCGLIIFFPLRFFLPWLGTRSSFEPPSK